MVDSYFNYLTTYIHQNNLDVSNIVQYEKYRDQHHDIYKVELSKDFRDKVRNDILFFKGLGDIISMQNKKSKFYTANLEHLILLSLNDMPPFQYLLAQIFANATDHDTKSINVSSRSARRPDIIVKAEKIMETFDILVSEMNINSMLYVQFLAHLCTNIKESGQYSNLEPKAAQLLVCQLKSHIGIGLSIMEVIHPDSSLFIIKAMREAWTDIETADDMARYEDFLMLCLKYKNSFTRSWAEKSAGLYKNGLKLGLRCIEEKKADLRISGIEILCYFDKQTVIPILTKMQSTEKSKKVLQYLQEKKNRLQMRDI